MHRDFEIYIYMEFWLYAMGVIKGAGGIVNVHSENTEIS